MGDTEIREKGETETEIERGREGKKCEKQIKETMKGEREQRQQTEKGKQREMEGMSKGKRHVEEAEERDKGVPKRETDGGRERGESAKP